MVVPRIKTISQKYFYIHCSNNNPIPNRSIISWPPGIQSSNERKQNKDDIAKLTSHHLEGEQKIMITDQQNYNCKDTPQLTSIDVYNVDKLTKKKVEVSSKLLQLSEIDKVNINMQ